MDCPHPLKTGACNDDKALIINLHFTASADRMI
jgi:hypothetical protein